MNARTYTDLYFPDGVVDPECKHPWHVFAVWRSGRGDAQIQGINRWTGEVILWHLPRGWHDDPRYAMSDALDMRPWLPSDRPESFGRIARKIRGILESEPLEACGGSRGGVE